MDILDLGQPPLGLLERVDFVECAHKLETGEKIVLYTDGVSEARSEEMFGTEGVKRCLTTHGSRPVEELVDCLVAEAREWAQGRLRDDVAVAALHRLSP